MLAFDHIAISAATLDEGVAYVERALGATPVPGGHHPLMGTHNQLLSLGPGEYLEVIAIDPEAPHPGRARWFDLDRFEGPPRITNWVARTNEIDTALGLAPADSGLPLALTRGDLAWTMAVPSTGRLPFDGAFPALIEWDGAIHPADRLPDAGLRLAALEISHPENAALEAALDPMMDDPRVHVMAGPKAGIRAIFGTWGGPRVLE